MCQRCFTRVGICSGPGVCAWDVVALAAVIVDPLHDGATIGYVGTAY